MLLDHDKSFSSEFLITLVVGVERKEDTKLSRLKVKQKNFSINYHSADFLITQRRSQGFTLNFATNFNLLMYLI